MRIAPIVHAFAFNRALSMIVLIGVVFFGTLAYILTPKQYNPEIVRPAFSITVEYPGAHVEEVEQLVTKELIEKVQDVPHIDEITAYSYEGGRSIVLAVFDVNTDIETTKVLLYTRLMQSATLAQGRIGQPTITTISPDDVPIFSAVLYSNTVQQNDLRTYAITAAHELQKVPGVANVSIHGGESRALTVRIQPELLAAYNLTPIDIEQALTKNNYLHTTSTLSDGNEIIALTVDGTIRTAADARRVIVAPGILLQDIAHIEDSFAEKESIVSFATQDASYKNAVYISAAKQEGAHAPLVAQALRIALTEAAHTYEQNDISYAIMRDDGLVAEQEIRGLGMNLLQSIIIVGIVLLLFLSIRPALVVMSAIPLTLLLVFFVAWIYGETINRITLFALILSLGLLVDSATVVVENIFRHIQNADNTQKDAAVVHAVQQVSMGLVLSTITSVVVFLPVAFITGMMGPYMGPLSFFVPLSLVMSLVVAFVITPFLSYTLLTGNTKDNTGILGNFFDTLTKHYTHLLRTLLFNASLKKKVLQGSVVALGVALMLPAFGLVHFQMLPKADKNQYYIHIDAPKGSDILNTEAQAQIVLDTITKDAHVLSTQLFVGEPPIVDFNGMFKGVMYRTEPHQASIIVNLTDSHERNESSSDIVHHARAHIRNVPLQEGVSVRVLEEPPGPPVMATFVAKVFGEENAIREQLAHTIQEHLGSIEGATDTSTSIEHAAPRLVLRIDEERAREHGVQVQDVARTFSLLFEGAPVSQYHMEESLEYAPVIVATPRNERSTPAILSSVYVRAYSGELVPLLSVASYTWSRTIPPIVTENREPVTYVTAETDNRSIVYVLIDTIRALRTFSDEQGSIVSWNIFGMDYQTKDGALYHIAWDGEWKMTLENFRDLGLAMLIALFLVYAILVAQYGSYRTPALIMATVPFGLIGILFGFFVLDTLFDIYLTATALIGFIALIGIVVNNAILFLEYFDEIKKEKPTIDERELLIEAGSMRLRPILLTSLTTVLGSLTIAADPVWSGLAWAIVFGLSLSTVLTLIIFPLLYSRN